jgi:uncharacterized protein (TIGR02677 family)
MSDATSLSQRDRLRLEALRYAVATDETADYIAIMRTFTGQLAGLLSDQSAAEVAQRLADQGLELDVDTVDARLSYLVEHGNLARSPRETQARSIKEYLTTRARYQLTQRGELVHRQVEELLGATEAAREVSTEMLGALLDGLTALTRYDDATLATAEPDRVAGEITTLFAQFERLVDSTRDFYTYLSDVLARFDLDRGEVRAFKAALLDYLQRFVDEVARHMPQIAQVLLTLDPRVAPLVARANTGQRLHGLDGGAARRSRGLDVDDWRGLRAWFVGDGGRASDAQEVRQLATQAMRSLLVNLRRIAASGEREASRYADLLRLARWFDDADDATAHALWASAFGLYSCRHLGFPADPAAEPVPATASWWRAPVADVPMTLRQYGDRVVRGQPPRREDFAAVKAARLRERDAAERRRRAALAEVAGHHGRLETVRLSDDARTALLDLYAQALASAGSPLRDGTQTAADVPEHDRRLAVRRTPGTSTTIVSPAGRLQLVDLTLEIQLIEPAAADQETA